MYKVIMRKESTGEIRACDMDLDFKLPNDESDGDVFWWTEGNFGCDCNRHIVFEGKHDKDHIFPCGYKEYTVLYCELPDGTKVSIDVEKKED